MPRKSPPADTRRQQAHVLVTTRARSGLTRHGPRHDRRECRRPRSAGDSARDCSPGTRGTAAICRGGRPTDPYHILVSEIMLQQTQVDRVLPKYEEWLDKYPSLDALAAAPEEEVTATWYPLGYNIRPRRLQAIAREAVARYGGRAAVRRARRCCRSRESAPTRPARSAASPSASARRSSTPTSRACCFGCSSAGAIRRATR